MAFHTLSMRLLDRFGLLDDKAALAVPPGTERVLALLAVRGGTVGRSRVAGMLWPEVTERRALACLRSALRRLPPTARPAVQVTPAELALADAVPVDLRTGQALARRLLDPATRPAEDDLGGAALAVLATELLPDWYDDWLVTAAESWRQLRLHALEALAAHLTTARRYGEAAEAAVAAVTAEPLRESAHSALIRVHLAEGNRSEALRQYHRYRQLLRAELGVEPTTALHQLLGLPGTPAAVTLSDIAGATLRMQGPARPGPPGWSCAPPPTPPPELPAPTPSPTSSRPSPSSGSSCTPSCPATPPRFTLRR
jgi:SARP family transcriptional regulator, regulator of embCAB operon